MPATWIAAPFVRVPSAGALTTIVGGVESTTTSTSSRPVLPAASQARALRVRGPSPAATSAVKVPPETTADWPFTVTEPGSASATLPWTWTGDLRIAPGAGLVMWTTGGTRST